MRTPEVHHMRHTDDRPDKYVVYQPLSECAVRRMFVCGDFMDKLLKTYRFGFGKIFGLDIGVRCSG